MLVLEPNQVCPYSNTCKYNEQSSCQGSHSNRPTKFTCSYVNDGKICEGGCCRNILDQTGKMQIIMENI